MKKCLIFIFAIIIFQTVGLQAQSIVDNDKLLEFYQTQRYSEAAAYLQTVFMEDTQDPKELSQLAYSSLMAGKLADAEKSYLKLYTQQPTNLSTLFSLANISIRRGIDEKAKGYYEEVLKLDSTNFNVYKQLASLNKDDINTERIKYLRKANTLNPTDADVAFSLCEIYFNMNFFGEASKVLQPALAADSTNLQLLKMKMPISMANKKYDESIATGFKLLSFGDSSTFVLNNLAKSYFLKLDYRNALKYFLIIRDKSFDNEGLYYNIGLSYRGIKDYKNAAPYFEKAITEGISTKIASYYGLLGDSFEEVNKNEEANVAYKRGLLFENNGSLLYNIALVYETRLNDKKNAISYYEQYLKTINEKEQPKLITFIKNKVVELKK
ncbi:tetratricopeptide repeat protein [Pedobacter sp. JCM 36344]|uniref:tetratricopeptide repeat protein n=1 Tax=Pedobacter sp. JCM 36344 TaxID=3374280 RepID=UPI00397C4A9D